MMIRNINKYLFKLKKLTDQTIIIRSVSFNCSTGGIDPQLLGQGKY